MIQMINSWRHGGIDAWRYGGMEAWRYGGMEARRHRGIIVWRTGFHGGVYSVFNTSYIGLNKNSNDII